MDLVDFSNAQERYRAGIISSGSGSRSGGASLACPVDWSGHDGARSAGPGRGGSQRAVFATEEMVVKTNKVGIHLWQGLVKTECADGAWTRWTSSPYAC